jgi:hypothetical protein
MFTEKCVQFSILKTGVLSVSDVFLLESVFRITTPNRLFRWSVAGRTLFCDPRRCYEA